MTPDELRTHLARLRLSQTDLARVVRVTPRSVRRWLAGDAMIKYGTAELIRRLRPEDPEVCAERRADPWQDRQDRLPGNIAVKDVIAQVEEKAARRRRSREIAS